MIRPDLEALLHRALDNTLTPDERAQLARLISDSPEARDRAAQLTELAAVIDSLGPVEAPPGLTSDVLAQISYHPHAVRPSTFQRGVSVNKRIFFGLAAAAAIVLAVITYYSNPRATVGTEATIGAAQRAQTPQIAANDVKLGDTSAQDVLQTETFDAIMKDDAVRTALQDAELRTQLQSARLRDALQDDAIRVALRSPGLIKQLNDPALARSLNSRELTQKFNDANLRALMANRAFADALRSEQFRNLLSRNGMAAALAGTTFLRALRDPNFEAAMRSDAFAARLAGRLSAQ